MINPKPKTKSIHRITATDIREINKLINQYVHEAINNKETHCTLEFDEDIRENFNLTDTLEPVIRSLVANQYRVQVLSENINENINVYYLNISWQLDIPNLD